MKQNLYALPLAALLCSFAPLAALSQTDNHELDILENTRLKAVVALDLVTLKSEMASDYIEINPEGMIGPDKALSVLAGMKSANCTIASSTITGLGRHALSPDTLMFTYHATGAVLCGDQNMPFDYAMADVWTSRDRKWMLTAHTETPLQPKH